MNRARLEELCRTYREGLLEDVVPFWIRHAVDREQGGFLHCLDRDGSVTDTDKGLWVHGRFAWLLATLCSEVEERAEWLDLSRHGIDFLRRHGFDTDGRMFFQVTRDGRPLRKRRYVFTECFAVAALAAYARAAGCERSRTEALELFRHTLQALAAPALAPKVDPRTRPMKALAVPMILLVTAQVLREATDDALCDATIDRCLEEIERDFVKPEHEAVLETVGPGGEVLDHTEGRTLNPGHAIEAAWFVLVEARHRGNDPRLVRLGTTMLDWMWTRGWDTEHGGLFYFRDLRDLPVQEYWHDMKFWWPHNEAVIATLLAWSLTGEGRYARWHAAVHDWTHAHFPDPEHGEWFGYLHRDGSLSSRAKGNLWKGPFHVPRMQLLGWQLAREALDRGAGVRAE